MRFQSRATNSRAASRWKASRASILRTPASRRATGPPTDAVRGGNNDSPLAQITPANVTQLTKAWTYNTGDIRGPGDSGETTYEVTPIKIADTVYRCTPHNIAIALDPVSGTEKWRFDPKVGRSVLRQHQTCRGVSYCRVPNATVGAPCSERIILPAADAKLYALDAANGQICPTFGQNGVVDLWANMPDHSEGAYYITAAIARNLIICER